MAKTDFTIDKAEVLRYRGHRSADVPPQTDRLAQEMTGSIHRHISPRHITGRFSVTQVENGVLLDGGLLLQGQDVKKHLSGCDECYILCATVGIQADNFIRTQLALGSVYGLMADAAATAAVFFFYRIIVSVESGVDFQFGDSGEFRQSLDAVHG